MSLKLNSITKREESTIKLVKRRLVEDVFSCSSENKIPLLARPLPENISISSKLTSKMLLFPGEWVSRHVDRCQAIQELGVDPVPCLLMDLSGSVETATKVVFTLWSALRSHWSLEFDENLNNLIDSVLWYVPMCGEEQEFIPFLKYQLSYLFAKGERQLEMPERPGWIRHNNGLVLPGFLGSFFKTRCFGHTLRNREFRNTVLNGIKKGLPQMGPFHLIKNLKAMKDRLTVKRQTPGCLLDEVSRTAKEIYPGGVKYEDWYGAQPWTMASSHASYQYSRSKGGNLQLLRDLDGDWSEHMYLEPDCLASMYYDPSYGTTRELRWPGRTLEQVYNSVQRLSVLSALEQTGSAHAKPIFEPLKVRMISAGDVLSNGLFGNLQKLLWKKLQRFEQFKLTGKSVECDDIAEVDYQSLVRLGSKFKYWVSGDYSAATDNLNTDATRAVIDALSVDPITRAVLVRGLQETLIDFDSIELEGVPAPFTMTNGQLMGCVFSFPILCIINLAVYRASLEAETGERYRIDDLPVLVNGDDILFKTNSSHYKIWCGLIKGVGFEKSVGKNYVSKSMAMINSTYFRTDKKIKKVPYLNLGWCTGVSKGGSGSFMKGDSEEEQTVMRIQAQVRKTESDWLWNPDYRLAKDDDRRAEIVERFKDEIHLWNWDRIKESCVSCGGGPAGLGLKKEVPDYMDAFSFVLQNERERPVMQGLSSYAKSIAPWKVTKLVPFSTEEELASFRSIFKKFSKAVSGKPKVLERIWEMNAQRYLNNGFRGVEREFEESRYVVGAFPTQSARIGDEAEDSVWIYFGAE
jgi:hypothetical protein